MKKLVAALLAALPIAAAAEPLVVTHQGYLLGPNDAPVEEPALPLAFKLFTTLAPNDTSERLVWQSRACPTTVKAGRYVALLGDTCNGDTPLATDHLPATQARYLEIHVNGERLLPRLAITAAPVAAIARNAERVGGLDLTALDARFDAKYAPLAGSSSSGYALLSPGTAQTGDLDVTGAVKAGSFRGASATLTGALAADTLVGNGAGITGLSATQLTLGTLPDARLSGGYTGALTFSNAQNAFTGSGAGLTGVNALKLGGLTLDELDTRYARVSGGTTGAVAFPGALKFGNGETTCNAASAGTVRWDGANFLGCDGTDWRQLNNAPAPRITSIVPNTGSTLGGGTVTVNGTNFSSGAAVLLGEVATTNVTYVSPTQLRVGLPPGTAGVRTVKVVNADNQAFTLENAFTYVNGVFSYTGANQTFTVPAGVTQITAKIWGAGGGGGRTSNVRGGAGGYTTGTITVQPGQSYVLVVGQGGRRSATQYGAGVGGGLSGLFLESMTQANARLVAGGGGGGGYYDNGTFGSAGGNGGGLVGGDGGSAGSSYQDSGGKGGTQGAGGAGGIYAGGYAGSGGSALQGGGGGIYSGGSVTSGTYGGGGGSGGGVSHDSGGGGGGYWGGGGGSNNAPLGGGGGSGFIASGVTNGTTQRGDTPGIPPFTTDPAYAVAIAYGGYAVNASTTDGGHGRIALYW